MKTTPKCTIAVLAAALMIVFAVTSCTKTDPVTEPVSTESSEESDSSSEERSDDAAAVPIIGSSAGRDSSSSSSDEGGYSSTAEATSTVSVGGVVIRSQISGAYSVKGFAGFAVRMGADAIRGLAGISGTPFVRAYDITPKKCPSAFVSINAAAASVGATVLGVPDVSPNGLIFNVHELPIPLCPLIAPFCLTPFHTNVLIAAWIMYEI